MDTSIAESIQQRLMTGEPRATALMYSELRFLATKELSRMGSNGRTEEMSHDVAANLVTQYLKHPGYQIRNIWWRLHKECKSVMAERDLNPHSKRSVKVVYTDKMEEAPDRDLLESQVLDIQLVANLRGLFSCYKYFAPAIRQLRPYVQESWLASHARCLYSIFRDTRGMGSMAFGTMSVGSL